MVKKEDNKIADLIGSKPLAKNLIDLIGDRIVIGLTEHVNVLSDDRVKKVCARIDTGATRSSIDIRLAAEMKLGPVIHTRLVKSSLGSDLRPVVKLKIEICGKIMDTSFTLADREHMQYKILIGQNILKDGFIIDPLKGSSSEMEILQKKSETKKIK